MFENIQRRWTTLAAGAKAGLAAGVLAIVLLFIGASAWVLQDNDRILFSGLDPQDAATMTAELDRLKVPYRLEDAGTAILVDKDMVNKMRIKLMSQDVSLKGTVGFEIFNANDFGTSEFAQRINYQRALQGELARTIMDIDGVRLARVHLVLPDSGMFKKESGKPKASVSLIMKDGRKPAVELVAGIRRLVAASAPQIDPAAVTVIDQRGVALSHGGEEGDEPLSTDYLENKKQVETYLMHKISDMLDKVAGTGEAIVSVDATLTQDHVKLTREDVIPLASVHGEATGAVVRRHESGHASGRSANLTTSDKALSQQPSRADDNATQVDVDYQNGRKLEQTVSMPGAIKRLAVGVLLPESIGAAQVDKIRDVVAMAAGLTPERGDTLAVHTIAYVAGAGPVATPAPVPAASADMLRSSGHWRPTSAATTVTAAVTVAAMLIILLIGGLWLAWQRPKSIRRSRETAPMNPEQREAMLVQVRQWLGGKQPEEEGA